jgi:hypothetical protein
MLNIVNILGLVTVGLCAMLLLRAYARVRKPLLLWSGLCFAGLTVSSALLVVDLAMLPGYTLYRTRLAIAAASMLVLVYGLIFESD